MYTTTFEEPRAWAVEWDGSALLAAQQPQPAREIETVTWRRMALPAAPATSRNGEGVFADPRSWALGWEGTGLVDARNPAQPQRAAEEI